MPSEAACGSIPAFSTRLIFHALIKVLGVWFNKTAGTDPHIPAFEVIMSVGMILGW